MPPASALARRMEGYVPLLLAESPHVQDLSDVFANDTSDEYYDWMHLTPHGNQIVAHAIWESVLRSGVLEHRGALHPLAH